MRFKKSDFMIEDYVRAHDEFLGYGVAQILNGLDKTECSELVINSNSGTTQTIFLDYIKTIKIYNNFVIFIGLMGNHDFLNLNNVLSISIVKQEV